MDILGTAQQVLALFLIMVVGYVMYKRHIIDDEANVRYTRLVLNISLPAQIITAFVSNQGIVSKREVLNVFGLSIIIYIIYALIGVLFLLGLRVQKEQRGTYLFMMMFGNVGFMGFPVIEAIFGEEAIIYAVIFNVIFNILVYSVGILMIGGKDNGPAFEWKKLFNMPLLSAVVSIILFFAGIRLPEVVMTSLGFLGNVTTPVAMLILGAVLAKMPIRALFDEWRIYVFTIMKLLALPLVVMLLFRWIPIQSELIKGCIIILSATPVATNSTMLAIEYDGDVALASKGIFFTTVLSIVTIPLMAIFC